MSKIAEQKALEEYPPEYEQEDFDETWDMNFQYREPYTKGYDQAMKDFLEKAEKFLERHKRLSNIFFDEDFICFFKEQMMED